MTKAAKFCQSDITRLVKGASKAGIVVQRIEIDLVTGKVVILTNDSPSAQEAPAEAIRERIRKLAANG